MSPPNPTNPAPADMVQVPTALLRWLCVNIMATQRAIQNAGLVGERRLQREIDNAAWEYDAEMEKQKQERAKEQAAFSEEADRRLENNPFLTVLRTARGIDPVKDDPCPSSTSRK